MMNFIKKEETKIKIGIVMFVCILLSILALYFSVHYKKYDGDVITQDVTPILYSSNNVIDESAPIYLSDIEPIQKSFGYRDYTKDKAMNGSLITLRIENNLFSFQKGLFVHAKFNLVYDLTSLDDEYKYFVAFVGLNNTAASSSNGVNYHFYTSNDNQNWEQVGDSLLKKPGENATYVEVPLNGAKYLKIYIDDNGGNGNDHSVLADAKFVKNLENNFDIPSYDIYDNDIKTKYANQTVITDDFEFTLLKRELLKNVGQYTINSFYNASVENANTINWLMSNPDILRYYILGGTPDGGSYYNSLTELSRLYNTYKNDFNIKDVSRTGYVLGELYKKLAISISLTHSTPVYLWMQASQTENVSDAVRRYEIFKYMYAHDMFIVARNSDGTPRLNANGDAILDHTSIFESLEIEEMRYVVNNIIDDESIIWLNEYTQQYIDANPGKEQVYLQPHYYKNYIWPNYARSEYHDANNKDYYNIKYGVYKTWADRQILKGDHAQWHASKGLNYTLPDASKVNGIFDYYNVTFKNGLYKLWMDIEGGSVCGGISKIGSNIRGVHGMPSSVISQPGHAALIYYQQNSSGDGYWSMDNGITGWNQSGKTERLNIRMPLGWGNASYVSGWAASYIIAAQEAINDFDTHSSSAKLLMLSDIYKNDSNIYEKYIREALKVEDFNLDAWWKLIQVYNSDLSKTEKDYYDLAVEMSEALLPFPLPLYNLLAQIKTKITSVEYTFAFTTLQNKVLNDEKAYVKTDKVLQPAITRQVAEYLLGQTDTSLATFSFDGSDAGKIVLSNRFDGNGIRWDYSLDGKNTWNEVSFSGDEPHKLQLTQEQIESINEENDIYIHIVGMNYEENNIFKIDITKGTPLNNIFANDLENRLIGVNANTEWRYTNQDSWTSYQEIVPDLTGDKTIQIRQGATGTKLPSVESGMYSLTMDNQPDTRKYVSISHLSIHSVSTEATANAGAAANSIDGNYNTRWHSAWNGTDTERFIVIKLDSPVYLSAVEFVPSGGGNGKIYDGTIYGSLDGENWEVLTSAQNITYKNNADTVAQAIANTKSFEIEESKEVLYVKIVANRTNGNWFSAREFNLYQDITKKSNPTAGIHYSTTDMTNGEVVASLVDSSTRITITNNNGSDTYIFKENGEFTFEFEDEFGFKGSVTARVDWIDKKIPTADIEYNLDNDKKIVILLDNISEDVYLLDSNNNKINYIEVENGKVSSISYLDNTGSIYKIIELDENGCIVKITYKNMSDKVPAVASFTTIVKDGVVESAEYYDYEGNVVTVTSLEQETLRSMYQSMANPLEYTFENSGEYEFKILDKASNLAYKSIKVDYVNGDILVSDITYDIMNITNQDVTAIINAFVIGSDGQKREAEIISGEDKYTFVDNGVFAFKYKDIEDTIGDNIKQHIAQVDWIDKKIPTADIVYETKENGIVIVKLVNESETIKITNNNASRIYIFALNGEFTFEFEDLVGNKGTATAVVNSIKKDSENGSSGDDNSNDSSLKGETGVDINSVAGVHSNNNNVLEYNPKPEHSDTDITEPSNNNEIVTDKNDSKNETENKSEFKIEEENNETNKFRIYAVGFIILGLLISGIIILKSREEKE